MSPSLGVAPTRPNHFTPDEESRLCSENLAWAENLLRKHYGKQAIEWAGEGLILAIRAYDPDRGYSFRGFAATVIKRTAAKGLKALHGSPGSAKHEARANTVTYEDYDHPVMRSTTAAHALPDEMLKALSSEDRDESRAIIEFIERQPMRRRLIGLGAMLTGMSPRQLSEVMHIDRREIATTLVDLRRLVSAA